jgi:Xaa-Pro dipeptidase
MLHFTAEDYAARLGRTEAALAARGLDGLLLFGADSAYWLCGLDAGAPSGLTCLILGGVEPVLFLPAARALQARLTSNVEDIRPWHAAADADPAAGLAALLGELGLAGKRLGVETTALPAAEFLRLQAALDGTLRLAEGAGIVDALALVKSESELIYLRRAAGLADDSLDSALDRVRSGAESGRILAAMQETMLAGGGDCPALPMVAGAGKQALLTAPRPAARHCPRAPR